MATVDQIQALIKAHYARDNNRFDLTVRQIASHMKGEDSRASLLALVTALVELPIETRSLVYQLPTSEMSDLMLSDELVGELRGIVAEQRFRVELAGRGLRARSRLLFHGPPGNGKTLTAAALATALQRQAYGVSLPMLVESYMGNTSRNVQSVFRVLESDVVLLADEVDAIGATRTGEASGSSREYNTIVNSLLTTLDRTSAGILIATTNRVDMLDQALRRRFDCELFFDSPKDHAANQFIARLASQFGIESPSLTELYQAAPTMSWDFIAKTMAQLARTKVVAALEERGRTSAVIVGQSPLVLESA